LTAPFLDGCSPHAKAVIVDVAIILVSTSAAGLARSAPAVRVTWGVTVSAPTVIVTGVVAVSDTAELSRSVAITIVTTAKAVGRYAGVAVVTTWWRV
jgi:hypothetical protein